MTEAASSYVASGARAHAFVHDDGNRPVSETVHLKKV